MLKHQLLKEDGMLVVTPDSPLTSSDFAELALKVDPYLEREGALHALVIEAHAFPGWQDLNGLISHFRFVHDHHRKIKRVAVISDSKLLSFAPQFMRHFVAADIRHFTEDERQAAIDWARGG